MLRVRHPVLKRAYDRAEQMAKDGVVSESALDDAEKGYKRLSTSRTWHARR